MSKSFEKSLRQLKTGRDILLALKGFGPLSKPNLQFIMKEPSLNKINLSLRRLIHLNLIEKINYRFEGHIGAYYYFNSRLDVRILLAEILGDSADDYKQEFIRYKELPHEQRCARTQYSFMQMFPDAKFYRDYQLDSHGMSERVFPNISPERRIYPDILMHYEDKTRDLAECFIGFEIEQSLKSKRRILEKLNLYSTRSLLDGVVYISTASQISETIRRLFTSQVLQKNLRIKHYGEHFLLFQNQEDLQHELKPIALNSYGQNVDLMEWAILLMRTRNSQRRNSHFRVNDQRGVVENEKG